MYFARQYKDIIWKRNKRVVQEGERHTTGMKIDAQKVQQVMDS